ncbi:hypothetical protein [Mycolicibacterium sp. HK-90]|uniref:hypothetical protein n=1 Tax=Mycolicibacterium sp. HK-90 TaxID=3056937 RepID=UPI00265AC456|nr:hypothetical protein [Mycolicibacterium sp. HK-90]WKG01527.1 hypothetical protein QU592_19920 [Mycolicibacterium sp. HK-90]
MSLPPPGPPPYGPPPYGQQPPPWPPPYPQQWPGAGGPVGPPPYGQPPHWSPAGPPLRPRKSGLGIAIVAVLAVIGVLVVGVVGFTYFKVATEGETVTAHSVSSFSEVCENGAVTNAAAYGPPYKIAAFYYNFGFAGPTWSSAPVSNWTSGSEEFTEINVVACLDRKDGTEVKVATCEDDEGGANITVEFYSVDYEITYRQAKTGEVIRRDTVGSTGDRCPIMGTYNKKTRKMYAGPDMDALEAKLQAFAG